jgi:hypothetical protein
MAPCIRASIACGVALGVWIAAGCAGEPPVDPPLECLSTVMVTVAGDTIPTFSWSGDCTIGRLIVLEGVEERWGTETLGINSYQSPIVYGIAPPGASKDEPPQPLYLGTEYEVSLWRFFSVMPESLQLLGRQTFTPRIQ